MTDFHQVEISFHDYGIEFRNYPYQPASIYPSGRISLEAIKESDPDQPPPEIRIEGEILFVPATLREDLRRFALDHSIPIVKRIDIWDLLLDPFLDTEFDDQYKERSLKLLEECGVSREESKQIRRFVAKAMEAYNFTSMLWEWVHLGLFDVLEAFRGVLSGQRHKLAPREYEEFYWRAMKIAFQGKIIGGEKKNDE